MNKKQKNNNINKNDLFLLLLEYLEKYERNEILIDKQQPGDADKACAFLMKSPIKQMLDTDALDVFNKILQGHTEISSLLQVKV